MKNLTITKFIDLMIGNDATLDPDELKISRELNFSDHMMLDEDEDGDTVAGIDSTYLCEREEFMDDVIFLGRIIHGQWGLQALLDYVSIIVESNSDVLINSFEDKLEAMNTIKADILGRVQQEEKVI